MINKLKVKLSRVFCYHKWYKTGCHRMMTNEMDVCMKCGLYRAGPDGRVLGG